MTISLAMTSGVPDSAGVPKGCTEDTMTAVYNDLDSVKALVTDKTCAIILEPLQGEGGINLATEEFMRFVIYRTFISAMRILTRLNTLHIVEKNIRIQMEKPMNRCP